ncbi:hypothetical protein V6N12_068762 [Hibiscus sabdariffa]|uniref:Uncharacterized protein n=1 Tax=Hibiscus sabdariffa TaxID=183260 RepID=A0ABR1ZVK5_9ROSI
MDIVLRITAIKVPQHGSIADVVRWHGTSDLLFTVKSAYMVCCGQGSGSNHNVWRVLLRYKGLPRLKKLAELMCMDITDWIEANLSASNHLAVNVT